MKLLGEDHVDMRTTSWKADGDGVDLYSRVDFRYPHAVASARTGLGVKAEGDLVVGGTKGYLYVPAPWWKTEYFEARFENQSDNKKYYYKFDGDGLRYEIAEFGSLIRRERAGDLPAAPVGVAVARARAGAGTHRRPRVRLSR